MQRISDPHMTGTNIRVAKTFRKLCGENSMANVVILTTFWSQVTNEEGKDRMKNLEADQYFGLDLAKGAQLKRYRNTQESAHTIISEILYKENSFAAQIQIQMVDEDIELERTDAYRELMQELRGDNVSYLYCMQLTCVYSQDKPDVAIIAWVEFSRGIISFWVIELCRIQ